MAALVQHLGAAFTHSKKSLIVRLALKQKRPITFLSGDLALFFILIFNY